MDKDTHWLQDQDKPLLSETSQTGELTSGGGQKQSSQMTFKEKVKKELELLIFQMDLVWHKKLPGGTEEKKGLMLEH